VKSRTGRHGRRLWAALFFAAILVSASVSPAQQPSPPAPADSIRVGGEVKHPLVLTTGDIAALPHQSVSVVDEKNGTEVYQGVPVAELLRRAGAPLGKELRGPKMRLYVLVKARDGYAAVFALPEFDAGFTDRVILLADRRDGHPLDAVEGPLRLVVPGEKRRARWVRQVIDIEVVSAN
jgi:DMSO/TMAO reductase YedYZ molybdopterin-dependent catalytic subunit